MKTSNFDFNSFILHQIVENQITLHFSKHFFLVSKNKKLVLCFYYLLVFTESNLLIVILSSCSIYRLYQNMLKNTRGQWKNKNSSTHQTLSLNLVYVSSWFLYLNNWCCTDLILFWLNHDFRRNGSMENTRLLDRKYSQVDEYSTRNSIFETICLWK